MCYHLKIDFHNQDLKALCEQQATATRKLGANSARKLWARLADLAACHRVGELVVGKPHPLKGDRQGQCSLRLAGGCRLVFEPSQNPCPRHSDDSIDWAAVTGVRIVYIGDYHD